MKKLLNRRGRIAAPDHKFTGEEPEWNDWEELSYDDFVMKKILALKFYAYYLDPISAKSLVYSWMKKNSYSKDRLAAFDKISPRTIPTTIGKLVRMLDMGMPDLHPHTQEYLNTVEAYSPDADPHVAVSATDSIKMEIDAVFKAAGTYDLEDAVAAVVVPKVKVENPIEYADKNVLYYVDEYIDSLCTAPPKRIVALDVVNIISTARVHKSAYSYIALKLSSYVEELSAAANKTCDQAVESYSHIPRATLKKIAAACEDMHAAVSSLLKVKTTVRKPRIKKPRAVEKQIVRMKYLPACTEYGVKSVHPTSVPGSAVLYAFNTKTRHLHVYTARGRDGFEVKGTSLKSFDTDASYIVTLRNPKDVLHTLQSNARRKIDKLLLDITSAKRKATGRLNEHMILLQTYDTPT